MCKLIVSNIMSLDGYCEGPARNVMVLPIGPVVLGGGVPLFDAPPAGSLRLIGTPRTWDGSSNMLVRYEVRPQGT
jgi:hypothetical protein